MGGSGRKGVRSGKRERNESVAGEKGKCEKRDEDEVKGCLDRDSGESKEKGWSIAIRNVRFLIHVYLYAQPNERPRRPRQENLRTRVLRRNFFSEI